MNYPRPLLGELPYLPPIYTCPDAKDHEVDPCAKCLLIRPTMKTNLMKTLTAIQYGVLMTVKNRPNRPINASLVEYAGEHVSPAAGRLDEVRVAVAAGQLAERGLLSYSRNREDPGQLDWAVTELGLTYID